MKEQGVGTCDVRVDTLAYMAKTRQEGVKARYYFFLGGILKNGLHAKRLCSWSNGN